MNNNDTDGEIFAGLRQVKRTRQMQKLLDAREKLNERDVKYQEIAGGFLIASPNNDTRFYYYSSKNRWRVEGEHKYYRCKDVSDLLDRFILKEQK